MLDVPGVALKRDPGAGLGKAREPPGPMAPLAMQNPGLGLCRPAIVGPAPVINGSNPYANPSSLRYVPDSRASCIYMNSGAMPLSLAADPTSALVASGASGDQYSSGYLSQQQIPDSSLAAAPIRSGGHLWPDADVHTEFMPASGLSAQLRSADTFSGRRQSLLF